MPRERILILGGTGEARELAAALMAEGFAVTTSLAGVTDNPTMPPGETRRGGFGGAEGLADYVRRKRVALVADATHPFAARMSAHADAACRREGLPLLRLERPAWHPTRDDSWTPVSSAAEAAAALPQGARALVTIGRKEIAPFLARLDVGGILRMIEPPWMDLPPGWTLLRRRPPFSRAEECRLMLDHGIGWLVTKNAGGAATEAKLLAARELGLPVIMLQRPAKPEVQTFESAAQLAAEAKRLLSP